MKKHRLFAQTPALSHTTDVKVRFSEVDSMHIVWHGEYIRYFEDGREDFGQHYGLGYNDIYEAGYAAPIVDLSCQFKSPLTFGDRAMVETRYIAHDAAKIIFEYKIFNARTKAVVATGHSIQVFLNVQTRELELLNPDFYMEWKARWNIG